VTDDRYRQDRHDPGPSAEESPPGLPRWVLVLALVLGAVVLAVVALVALGGHQPMIRH
jgi:hypothetical protein